MIRFIYWNKCSTDTNVSMLKFSFKNTMLTKFHNSHQFPQITMFFIDLRTKWSPILSLVFHVLDSTGTTSCWSKCIVGMVTDSRLTRMWVRGTYQIQFFNMPPRDIIPVAEDMQLHKNESTLGHHTITTLVCVRMDFKSVMILPQVHLRKPCYDFYFL